jgi:methionine-rich copper-binding protein CopC
MHRSFLSAAIICALLPPAATAVHAYPILQSSNPMADTTVNIAPTQIKMNFSEALVARFTDVELSNAQGQHLDTGQANLDPDDNSKFAVTILPRLMPGTYTVSWHTGSLDTRRVAGKYWFTVAP